MSLQELEVLAKNGDVNACMALGKYCYEQSQNAEGMQNALEWYLIAAEQGSPEAMQMVILIKKVFAHAKTQLCADIHAEYEDAGRAWDEIGDWADKLMDATRGIDDNLCQFAWDKWLAAMYNLGVCAYFDGKEEAVMNMFKNTNEPKVQVLKGVAAPIKTEEDLIRAYEWLRCIETKEYFSMIGMNLEAEIAVYGALRISVYYRIIQNNANAAVAFLNDIINCFLNENYKKAIADEIGRYRKKMFGGYVYEN